ncbi:hypothetical protein HF086_013567 [Spodoptera exigua]|uniref:Uncharacterized protein n=1 Tax=Spodoptera exigua TaxID=7107 RepID=A0A922SMP3_SPOEX|nr:hypothetical protein HF086_013567 [Spodoptera exigua]
MKLFVVFVLSCFGFTLCGAQVMNTVEDKGWYSFKLPDYVQYVNESLLTSPVVGKLTYHNGFVVSVQHVDIQQSTVQQVWGYNSASGDTTVSVRGTLRMHEVAIGYDVIAELDDDDEPYHYTMTFVHPMITYAFSFDPNAELPAGMAAWGPEVFQPITYELVTKEIPFPQFCYNCAT